MHLLTMRGFRDRRRRRRRRSLRGRVRAPRRDDVFLSLFALALRRESRAKRRERAARGRRRRSAAHGCPASVRAWRHVRRRGDPRVGFLVAPRVILVFVVRRIIDSVPNLPDRAAHGGLRLLGLRRDRGERALQHRRRSSARAATDRALGNAPRGSEAGNEKKSSSRSNREAFASSEFRATPPACIPGHRYGTSV